MPKPFCAAIFVPAFLAALTCLAPVSRADDDAALDARINQALTHGADYLLARKTDGDHFGNESLTGLELYALLEIGRSIDDPRLRPNSPELAPVVAWLAAQEGTTASDAAFKILGLCEVPPTADLKAQAAKTREALLALLRPDGSVMPRPAAETWITADAAWTYTALAILEDSGFETNPPVWKNGVQWWRKNQQKDGSWPVAGNKSHSSPADTAAGLRMLYLTAARSPDTASPPTAPAADPIASALKKLAADFDRKSTDYVYLYQFQRAASAAGLRFIHGQDWFRATAEEILKAQRADGSWPGPAGLLGESSEANAQATSYALLFLAQARAPVLFSKLDYSADDSPPSTPARWNTHARDAAHLTRWLSQQFDRPLNWQILSLHAAEHPWQGALDSPILLITGSGDPHFTDQDLAKLRLFVQSGGLIFSIADHADPAFTEAILKKYAPLLSEKHYEMRALPPNHELFDANLYAKIPAPPPLFALSNGIREWWIHSPTDLAAAWQNRQFANRDDFFLPANLLRYATGNGSLKNKLESSPPVPTPALTIARTIHLARLDYEGNPDPEPLAWPRFAAFAPARFHTALEITTLKPAQLDPAQTPLAHITGTTAFTLSEADRASLKKFLDHGGTLLADSGGASPKFTASFLDLVKKLYPDVPLAEIPINDPLYNGSLPDSFRLTEIQYRKYALLKMKDHQVKPRIQAVTINGRHVILFSPEDLTTGLLGTPTWAIEGYTPDSAFALTRNMLLYATQSPSAPPNK